MYYYRFGYLVFRRNTRDDKKCENCKTRFNCVRYVAIKYVAEKVKLKKLMQKSWDKNDWKMINEKSKDLKNIKPKEFLKKWLGKE